MSLLRTLRTVRYLKPGQMCRLALNRARRMYENPAAILRNTPPEFPGVRWSHRVCLMPHQSNTPKEILNGRMRFVGEEHDVGFPPTWNPTNASRLWRYNLHYMEYLWPLEYPHARDLVSDYLQQNVPARGSAGWEPYPLSLRIMTWCGYFFGLHREETSDDSIFQQRLWHELWRMGTWLERRLEWHLRANHLMENILALATIGQCFADTTDVARWRSRSRHLLDAQLNEQILRDGGHFERSPMYHARILLAVTMIEAGADHDLLKLIRPFMTRMQKWLAEMSHPDGDIVLFNDAALGVSPRANLLIGDRNGRQDASVFALPDTGYFGARGNDNHYVVIDAAPIGPDEQPGHAHADIFTFELSMFGRRAIVDSGTFGYLETPERVRCRSTAAHNTVSVGGEDQCEMWGAFRVGRRARPRDLEFKELADGFRLRAAHDGYARRGGAVHRRCFQWHRHGVLLVTDTMEGTPQDWIAHIHVDPSWELAARDNARLEFRQGGSRWSMCVTDGATIETDMGHYHPRFGETLPCTTLLLKPAPPRKRLRFAVFAGGIDECTLSDARLTLNDLIHEW